jgi:uncharacterized LabA/DUF88 family protein
MMYVDGENLAIRAKEFAAQRGLTLVPGPHYLPDVFVWFPGVFANQALTNTPAAQLQVQDHAIRSYYYTSLKGDDSRVIAARESLWSLGFQPEVFKKVSSTRAKGVDIALSRDMLRDAFMDNCDVALLLAGDGDYVPLVTEVKRLGKVVYLAFFETTGLSPELRLNADRFFSLDAFFSDRWTPPPPTAPPPIPDARTDEV